MPRDASAQIYDHLQCHKIKDGQTFKGVILNLQPLQAPPFAVAQGCKLVGKAVEFCIPSNKVIVEAGTMIPPNVLPQTQEAAGDYLCYKVKCPREIFANQELTDQFGSRVTGKVMEPARLCVPAVKGVPTTTTITTTSTTTSTTTTTLRPLCGHDGVCKVFATSEVYYGDFGGFELADAECTRLAGNAGLDGPFVAWLSTQDIDVDTRLNWSSGPFQRTDGALIASDFADLVDGSIANPIRLDETGFDFGDSFPSAWTATSSNGANRGYYDCAAWTAGAPPTKGVCGDTREVTFLWTEASAPDCDQQARLYCVEQ